MFEHIEDLRRRSAPLSDLTRIIGNVRSRWRLKLALRGVARSVGVAVMLFFVAAYGMEWARFSATSIIAARTLLAAAVVASVFYFLVRPLRRRVTDEQVALYLEEHEPTLQATLVSAVEANRQGTESLSIVLVQRLVEQALEACVSTDAVKHVEEAPLRRWGVVLAGVTAGAIVIVMLGPAFVRNALSAILLVQRSVEAATPYRIDVMPGNADVPKGADQTITAALTGFSAEDASLMLRRAPTAAFEALPLVRGEDGRYEGMLFDMAAPLEYFVEADGVRSPVFKLTVVELPYVECLELEYHFPAYTGLEPQKIEYGGDIAVLKGTEVRLRVFPTMKTTGGRVALNEKESAALTAQADGSLTAAFKADRDGFYRIELDAPAGQRTAASPQYTIDVLTDRPPSVSFAKPGRDTSASSIEEVYVEAQAEDDFGVRDLELVYSVNGEQEKTVKLFGGRSRLPEVTAGHTFYLEELGVEAGDAVSYYARALDNSVGRSQPVLSDLYFLRIRPFRKDFRRAQSQGGGGGGGGGGQVEALSEQQRQIISATFNVQRDRRTYTPAKLRESTIVVGLSQSRLREQVEGLLTRMNSRLIQRDPAFQKIVELLPQAVEAMQEAEGKLAAASPDAALPLEHRALQILQRAEEEYEQQISVQQNAGGGGGGGGSAQQQELAEIFEQELEKMSSRYETASQARQQSGDREVDALLEKLKELARRQEQEAARQRLRALEQGGGGSGGGAAQQRALAEQAEEAARRLERLAREENRSDLQDAARQMQQAADAMRRAAAGGGDAGAAAQASAALERLRETERRLQQNQAGRAERDINDAIRKAEDIARRQKEVGDEARRVAGEADDVARRERARRVYEEKGDLEARLNSLEQQLDRDARDASSTERAASRKMVEAAGSIRDNRLGDKLRYSGGLVYRGASAQAVDAAENEIAGGIEELRKRLGEAAGALGQGGENANRMENALERARRLARAAESLQERTRERAQRQGQQGQQGQGSQGSQGQGSEGSGGANGQQAGARGDANANGTLGRARGVDNWGGGYGGWEWGRNWQLTPEDIRQLRGEAREWIGEAQALRRDLAAERIDPRELDDPRVYQNASELQRLQSVIAEGLKRFEFGLRRQADASASSIVLSGSDEVPEDFRKLVQEYYRSLARIPK